MGAQNIYYNDLDFSISIESLASHSLHHEQNRILNHSSDRRTRNPGNIEIVQTQSRPEQTNRLSSMAISEGLTLDTGPGHHLSLSASSVTTCRPRINHTWRGRADQARMTGTVFMTGDKFTRIQPEPFLASSSSQSNIMQGWLENQNGECVCDVSDNWHDKKYSGPDPPCARTGDCYIMSRLCPCLFCPSPGPD